MLVAQELGARSREAHTAPVVDAALVRILKLLAMQGRIGKTWKDHRKTDPVVTSLLPICVKSSNLTLQSLQYPSFYESCRSPSKERISPFDLLFASIFEAFSRADRGGDITKVAQLSRELGSETWVPWWRWDWAFAMVVLWFYGYGMLQKMVFCRMCRCSK